MFKRTVFAAAVAIWAGPGFSWDGTDAETGAAVEIGKGNLVRSGRDIEVYDSGSGEYRDLTVENIRDSGSTVEVEVYDQESGEYRTFEMEGD